MSIETLSLFLVLLGFFGITFGFAILDDLWHGLRAGILGLARLIAKPRADHLQISLLERSAFAPIRPDETEARAGARAWAASVGADETDRFIRETEQTLNRLEWDKRGASRFVEGVEAEETVDLMAWGNPEVVRRIEVRRIDPPHFEVPRREAALQTRIDSLVDRRDLASQVERLQLQNSLSKLRQFGA